MVGKNAARADSTLASAARRLGGADVGTLQQQLRRQPRRHPRDVERIDAAAPDLHLHRRLADQHGENGDVLPQRLVEQRDGRAHLGDQALLLRDVELGGGAGLEPLLDQGEHAVGGVEVLLRDAQPVLRGEHVEIGGAHARDGREDDHLLVEAADDGGLLRRARGGAVLAPEIDLVAGVERHLEQAAVRSAGIAEALREAGERRSGSSAEPTILACASACMMRPMAAPMSRFSACASSIRLVSSRERKPRHQSSAGGAVTPCPAPYLGGISGARSGRSEQSAPGQHLHER